MSILLRSDTIQTQIIIINVKFKSNIKLNISSVPLLMGIVLSAPCSLLNSKFTTGIFLYDLRFLKKETKSCLKTINKIEKNIPKKPDDNTIRERFGPLFSLGTKTG